MFIVEEYNHLTDTYSPVQYVEDETQAHVIVKTLIENGFKARLTTVGPEPIEGKRDATKQEL